MSIASNTTSTSPETDAERAAAIRALLEAEPSPMIRKSIEAFRRDLPELLNARRGWWIAYHGDERLGFARRHTPLYEKCLRQGLSRDEFIVTLVEPWVFDPDEEIEILYDDV